MYTCENYQETRMKNVTERKKTEERRNKNKTKAYGCGIFF